MTVALPATGSVSSAGQSHQNRQFRRQRQGISVAVVRLVTLAYRAENAGNAALAAGYFAAAELACAMLRQAPAEIPLFGYVTTGDGLRFMALDQ